MAWFFKKKNKNEELLKTFDGRMVKYVTRRVQSGNNCESQIIGKSGRIAVIGKEIRIICGETDVFKGSIDSSKYYLLLSGDGVEIEGENAVTGSYDHITAYYSYYRK